MTKRARKTKFLKREDRLPEGAPVLPCGCGWRNIGPFPPASFSPCCRKQQGMTSISHTTPDNHGHEKNVTQKVNLILKTLMHRSNAFFNNWSIDWSIDRLIDRLIDWVKIDDYRAQCRIILVRKSMTWWAYLRILPGIIRLNQRRSGVSRLKSGLLCAWPLRTNIRLRWPSQLPMLLQKDTLRILKQNTTKTHQNPSRASRICKRIDKNRHSNTTWTINQSIVQSLPQSINQSMNQSIIHMMTFYSSFFGEKKIVKKTDRPTSVGRTTFGIWPPGEYDGLGARKNCGSGLVGRGVATEVACVVGGGGGGGGGPVASSAAILAVFRCSNAARYCLR